MAPSVSASLGAIALACAALAGTGCGPPPPIRPNLVLITADGVRPDWLSCYGGTRGHGDDVCAIAEHGALYVWAFATASSGAPSAASLLTSTYPGEHGVQDDPSTFLPALGPPTLAEALRDAGYATAAFVASPELNRSRHFDRGFDHFDDRSPAPDESTAGPIGVRARTWAAGAHAPWFVWIHFAETHGPFGTDEPEGYRAAYGEAMRRLERQLSQLVAVLDSAATPPGILLAGLHGQGLGEPGSVLGHGAGLDVPEIRVPLLWRAPRAGPGASVGRTITRPVSLVDVAPTILEAAGVRAPYSFEGVPLPHSDVPNETGERVLFAEHPDAIAVIRGRDLAILPRARVPRPGARARASGGPVLLRRSDDRSAPTRVRAPAGSDAAAELARLRDAVALLPKTWRRAPPPATAP